jgi:serine/threonine protein kinase/tetratricopeptide (TPR) repeat protein/TolB-like protein
MQHSQWERIKSVFEGAVALDPAEQRLYLRDRCGDDAALRDQVERMLRADDSSEDLSAGATGTGETRVYRDGETIASRFVIRRRLGAGGMGEVYEAEDLRLGERVAVKTIRPELMQDRRFRERFRREIQLARTVTHPNLCRIHDLLEDAEHPERISFTMEFLQGETLAAFLKRTGKLSAAEALPLVRQMAEGLAALHHEAIVHRDFKPGNVILSNGHSGELSLKITDFGLARRIVDPESTRSGVTTTREIIGTPRYMSPEQLTGKPVTEATDIYALGTVIYEMLTGRPPFPAEGVGENAIQKATTSPTPPSQCTPGLDPVWDHVILRCLDPEVARRPRTVMDVVHILEGTPLPPVDTSRKRQFIVQPTTPASANRRWLIVLWLALLLAAALAVSNWGFWRQLFVGTSSPGPAPAAAAVQRVAVLPFRAIGSNAANQDLAGGLTDLVTKGLSQYEGINTQLSVVPASEIRRSHVDTPTGAWKVLGANRAVEGTLQVNGERVELMLTLVDGVGLNQLETAIVNGAADQLVELRKLAVGNLSTMLGLRVQPSQIPSLRETSPGVEAWYGQGLSYLNRAYSPTHLESAIKLFERAIEQDPGYAPAYAGLAEAQWRMFEQYRDAAWVEKAQASIQEALRRDASLPDAHVTLGTILRGTGKYTESIAAFEEALRLAPRNADAFKGLADTYTAMGGHDAQAVTTYTKALELRPSDWQFYLWLGNFYLKRQNYDEAMRQYEIVTTMVPDNPKGYVNAGAVLLYQKRFPEAIPWLEKAVRLEPTAPAYNNLAICYGENGDFAKAAEFSEKALQLSPNDHKLAASLAWAYGWLHDPREPEIYRRAAQLAEAELRVNPKRDDLYSMLAMYYAGAGNALLASRWLERAEQRKDPSAEELARNAGTLTKLRRTEEAFAWLRRAVEKGRTDRELRRSLWLQPLLNDPRYQAFAKAA